MHEALRLITIQHTQESLSLAYLHALSGKAGVNLRVDRVYDYGVDGSLLPVVIRGNRRVESGFHLDFQFKSSVNWQHDGPDVVYDLEAKTYNDLVTRDPAAVRCVLLLLCLPADNVLWLESSENQMILRHCCYWSILEGEETPNTGTKRIRIPRANLLTIEEVQKMLTDERRRRLEL